MGGKDEGKESSQESSNARLPLLLFRRLLHDVHRQGDRRRSRELKSSLPIPIVVAVVAGDSVDPDVTCAIGGVGCRVLARSRRFRSVL